MSSTASSAERGSPANGAARRIELLDLVDGARCPARPSRRSAGPARRAGCAGSASTRSAPSRIRSATTAHSTRSPRNFGKITPRDTAPTWCPARPTRCRPDATDGGDSTCTTRSTAPMSMPSSSEDVATTAGSRPALRSSSTSARCSRDTEPWWARATTTVAGRAAPEPDWRHQLRRRRRRPSSSADAGPLGGQLVEPGGQPLGQPAGVGEHDRRAVRLDEVEHPLLDVRPDRGAPLRRRRPRR